MSICLGYDNLNQNDGAGAQVQRVLGIYSLSRKFNLGFTYVPILDIDPNPGDGMTSDAERKKLVSNLNSLLLKNIGTCNHDHKIVKMRGTRFFKSKFILSSYLRSISTVEVIKKRNILLVIDNPGYILHANPSFYSFCKQLDFHERISIVNTPIQIHAHIRRGLVSSSQLNERFVSTDWYSNILRYITRELSLHNIDFSLFVHTDAKKESSSWAISDELSSGSLEMYQERGLINNNRAIELVGEDIESNLNLDYPITLVTDINPLEAWEMMNRADILLIGKSSFSFCAALMNGSSIVIAPINSKNSQLSMPLLPEWLGEGTPEEIALQCITELRKKEPNLFTSK